MFRRSLLLLFLALPFALPAEEKVDLSIVHRIRDEALNRSQVMDHLFYLTDVHGPRLTSAPAYYAAARWVVERAKEYKLDNARLEKWGPFGRSWEYKRFSAHLIEPQYATLIGYPQAWTQGTKGVVTGEPVMAVLRTDADLAKWHGKLKGRMVMIDAPRETLLGMEPAAKRYTDADLEALEIAPEPGAPPRFGPASPSRGERRRFRLKLIEFLIKEGVTLTVGTGSRGDGGTIFGGSFGSREMNEPVPPANIVLTPEHYNRIARLLEKKIPVKVEMEVQARIIDDNKDSVNVIAEISGGKKKDEVVMLGGHLDSWHAGTGATDDATGCAVSIEAMRIIKSLGIRPDRTIRMALWGGEEQGLLGSRAYVKEHFADRETMLSGAEHAKLSGYFNYDNGGGRIRGVYLQGNDMMRPVFEAWFKPFHDLGAKTVSIRNTGGTDHLAFDAVGLPGFQFIQDSLEYMSRTHHSNMDTYERVSRADLMQSAAIMASFVWNAATREEMLPRKPLPKPQPRSGAGARQASE